MPIRKNDVVVAEAPLGELLRREATGPTFRAWSAGRPKRLEPTIVPSQLRIQR
jgi:hypothetical protein